MRRKKIAVLHAQVPFMRGGAEPMTENLTKNLIRHGYHAEMISMPFKWYPNNTLLDSFFMWRMADLQECNGETVDMVIALKCPTYLVKHSNKVMWLMHQHRPAYDLIDSKIAFGLNTIEGGAVVAKKIRCMDQIAIPESKMIYSISKNVSNRLLNYNGISSTPLYHPPALAGRYKAGEYGDYILSVGRLDPTKRVDLLIQALVYCDQKIHVKIAGRGAEAEHLQKLAMELGVEDRVHLLGFVEDEDLLELYANALAVCFPPIDEDYGYVTLESFMSKKPIITCNDSGGVLEFVKKNESGFITDCSPEEIGECFEKLFHNKQLAIDMGEIGYSSVKDISWDHVIDELTKTIR